MYAPIPDEFKVMFEAKVRVSLKKLLKTLLAKLVLLGDMIDIGSL